MRNTLFGYVIEDGKAVIDLEAAKVIRNIYDNYLNGMSLINAAKTAGLTTSHCNIKRLLQNKHYLGDKFYPRIIDDTLHSAVAHELERRAIELGRKNRKRENKEIVPAVNFMLPSFEQIYDNPYEKAEYIYSLITEVKNNGRE